MSVRLVAAIAVLGGLGMSQAVRAASAATELAPAPPQPYSGPWQLRPAIVGSGVRWDAALASFERGGERGATLASLLGLSWKLTPRFAAGLRLGTVVNDPPAGDGTASFLNPSLSGLFVQPLPSSFRMSLSLTLVAPLATGGGDDGNPDLAAANRAGILARANQEGGNFSANDFTAAPGVGLAYVSGGVILQIESTLVYNRRLRGAAVQSDAWKTHIGFGAHAGYFVLPWLAVSAELRSQHWLTTPSFIARDPDARHSFSVAGGMRFHGHVASRAVRPGVAYMRGLDDQLARDRYHILFVDLAVAL